MMTCLQIKQQREEPVGKGKRRAQPEQEVVEGEGVDDDGEDEYGNDEEEEEAPRKVKNPS